MVTMAPLGSEVGGTEGVLFWGLFSIRSFEAQDLLPFAKVYGIADMVMERTIDEVLAREKVLKGVWLSSATRAE